MWSNFEDSSTRRGVLQTTWLDPVFYPQSVNGFLFLIFLAWQIFHSHWLMLSSLRLFQFLITPLRCLGCCWNVTNLIAPCPLSPSPHRLSACTAKSLQSTVAHKDTENNLRTSTGSHGSHKFSPDSIFVSVSHFHFLNWQILSYSIILYWKNGPTFHNSIWSGQEGGGLLFLFDNLHTDTCENGVTMHKTWLFMSGGQTLARLWPVV